MSFKNKKLIIDYNELTALVESLAIDAQAAAAGNKTAGVRLRHGLRQIRPITNRLRANSIDIRNNTKSTGFYVFGPMLPSIQGV